MAIMTSFYVGLEKCCHIKGLPDASSLRWFLTLHDTFVLRGFVRALVK